MKEVEYEGEPDTNSEEAVGLEVLDHKVESWALRWWGLGGKGLFRLLCSQGESLGFEIIMSLWAFDGLDWYGRQCG